MRIEVDVKRRNNHGRCMFSASDVFHLDVKGPLAFRAVAAALDESQCDQLQETSDMCPTLAITLQEITP